MIWATSEVASSHCDRCAASSVVDALGVRATSTLKSDDGVSGVGGASAGAGAAAAGGGVGGVGGAVGGAAGGDAGGDAAGGTATGRNGGRGLSAT